MGYARGTTVSQESSRGEIERTLARYGADAFIYGWDGPNAMLAFRMHDRHIKFVLAMPDQTERRFTHAKVNQSGAEKPRTAEEANKLWRQACRERWRSLALVIKAKLEAVASGITVFEDEFMAHVVMPDGTTVGEAVRPRIEQAYRTGKMVPLIAGPKQN